MKRMATDVGGTFTDIVWVDDETGEVRMDKSPTTPKDVVQGVLAATRKTGVPAAEIGQFVHGSTVATNALIVMGGGQTGLIATKGFRDSLEIRRIARPDSHIYNIFWKKPPALIPRRLRLEVDERMRFTGEVIRPVNRADVSAAIASFKAAGVETIAICLIHAYANPAHEIEIRDMIRAEWPEVYVSMSHEVAREIREYERASSTAIDAYVKKPVVSYLRRLQRAFRDDLGVAHDPLVANSTGGVSTIDAIERAPIQMIASGPAGGAIGAAYLASITGYRNLVTADVGGTSYDVAVVADARNVLRGEHDVLGYAAKVTSIDVRSVGAGGGSLATVDEGGLLHVGPASAGADPGPMCYGKGGTKPATTDAAVVSGLIDYRRFAGGEMALDIEASRRGVGAIASALGIDIDDAAEGILTVARNNMADITRQVVVGQGHDPRDFAILGFGGGGGLFACDVARNLDIPTVIIPNHPAGFSAWGMLSADIIGSFARSYVRPMEGIDHTVVASLFAEMEAEAQVLMDEAAVPADAVTFERTVEARYEGQGHEVEVPLHGVVFDETLGKVMSDRFDDRHKVRYGHDLPAGRESVTFRLRAYGAMKKLQIQPIAAGSADASAALRETRSVRLAGARRETGIYERAKLVANNVITGPAIIEEPAHVTVIFPGDVLTVDAFGNMVVTIGSEVQA
jgi:N-methylhydantoinase A